MRKLVITALLLAPFLANAQDFDFGKLTHEERLFDRNKIDSNANAVFLKEYGTSRLSYDSETGHMKLVYQYHARIKLFNKEGFDAANVVIPIYKNGNGNNDQEFLSDLKASTFNFQNGKFEESEMSSKAVFNEEKSKYLSLSKFTLPNIKENSIIEYQYTIESPYLFNFKTWHFQSDLPKLTSTYVAYIPANYKYNVSLRGFYKLTENKAELSSGCLRIAGKDMDCSKLIYNMKDVPAFLEEDYMTAPSNYKSAIYFELEEVHYLTGSSQKYTKSWKDIDYELTSRKEFGGQMKRKDVFKTIVPSIIGTSTDELQNAKAIFEYIKKQVKWNNYYGKYSETSVKEVIDRRSGNVADINFALISALSAANLDVEAVMLSTRDNGTVNKLYPIISDFNYVVAKVNIGETSYLLDATEPLIPFGLLPLRCINDQGRVINLKKPSYWMDMKASKRSSSTHSLIGKMTEDGKIVGTITSISGGFHAFNNRREIKKYSSVDEYIEKLDERLTNMKIKNYTIKNIDSVENALIEEYQVEFNVGNAGETDNHFNPFFINPIRKNPFKLNERNYPVDLGAASEERISINITLPENFQLKEQPKDLSIGLPNQGGRYLLQTNLLDKNLTINQQLLFSKAIYTSEEYHYLKEFYNQIIQTQKSDVLISKSN
jgi:Fe-S cluster assembly iron-binding protein IscA